MLYTNNNYTHNNNNNNNNKAATYEPDVNIIRPNQILDLSDNKTYQISI